MTLKSSSLFIFFCLFTFTLSQQNSFKFKLKENAEECIEDFLPDKTLVVFEVNSSTEYVLSSVKSPENKIVESKMAAKFHHPFTTYDGGHYQFCMRNTGNTEAEVHFLLKYGVGAKDYSSIARTKDLQPVDMELEKLADRTQDLSHYSNFAQQHEKIFEMSLDSISSKIVKFSSLLIVIMAVIGIVETIFLKRFMERRKII